MKVREVINTVDDRKNNMYTLEDKLDWLNDVEAMIYEMLKAHEGSESLTWSGYDDYTLNKEMLVSRPYDKLYIYYLEAQIDLSNQEIDRYNNSIQLFNEAYQEYANYWNRTHKAISSQRIRY